jgi:hypothetical protein
MACHPDVRRESFPEYQYLIIGGAPKSGTTSLFRYLSDHPQVCAANRKETFFFAREFDYKKTCAIDETRESFESYFTHRTCPEAMKLEATPYTLYARNAAEKIRALLPSVAMLFILRDPIQRLLSDYRFHVQREHPSARGTFDEFIEGQRQMRGNVPNLIDLGCYIKYLYPFIHTFGRKNIIILFFEEVFACPADAMRDLCNRLGIDRDFFSDYCFEVFNPTVAVRSSWLNRLSIRLEPIVADIRCRIMKNPVVLRHFEKALNKGKSVYFALNDGGPQRQEVIPIDLRDSLESYYRDFNLELAEYLGRPLPWKSVQREAVFQPRAV